MAEPIIALTMGDPSGNGPELSVKALSSGRFSKRARIVLVGDMTVMENARRICSSSIRLNRITSVCQAAFAEDSIDVLDLGVFSDISQLKLGQVDSRSGLCAFLAVKKAIELAMAGQVDATVTNALNKEAMNLALEQTEGKYSDGLTHFDGHTEIYAHYTKTKSYCMMLMHHDLRVSHVSTHCSLREACDRVRKDRVLEVLRLTDSALKWRVLIPTVESTVFSATRKLMKSFRLLNRLLPRAWMLSVLFLLIQCSVRPWAVCMMLLSPCIMIRDTSLSRQ